MGVFVKIAFRVFVRAAEGGGLVDRLTIPLSELAEHDVAVAAVVPGSALRPGVDAGFDLGDVTVSGTMRAVESEYRFRGRITGSYVHACDRCLAEGRFAFDVPVDWYFERNEPRTPAGPEVLEMDQDSVEDDRVRHFEGNEINLADYVWEEVVLTAPAKFLCDESCKGLCPRCGANLNLGPCACPKQAEPGGGGFAALKDMFPEIRPESAED